ncbi:MAG: hypothetical protein QOD05_1594 [Microbacteriaceae bacterium]|jgi:AcrR family transcriptional regulator|nr:hypothetical protein [Microbacteriaceae bacterium]
MSVTDDELGLRERKRLATRRAIQFASVELASERGFDRVTVDEISHAANVSPRTFFNYFRSKESAIIGDLPELPDGATIERFVDAGPEEPILAGIGELMVVAIDDTDFAGEESGAEADGRGAHRLHELRRALYKDNPQLFAMRISSMHKFEDELSAVLERRLAHDDPELARNPEALKQRARLIMLVAFAAMRHAWTTWASLGGVGPLASLLRSSFAELQEVARTMS